MRIGLGSDHGGYELKSFIAGHLREQGHEVVDYGCDGPERVDYPTYGRLVGEAVADRKVELGIVFCGSGVGISIAANKVRGVRCACVSEPYSARMARLHNDSNVLALGGRVVGDELALMIVEEFLSHTPEGGRHEARRRMLAEADGSAP